MTTKSQSICIGSIAKILIAITISVANSDRDSEKIAHELMVYTDQVNIMNLKYYTEVAWFLNTHHSLKMFFLIQTVTECRSPN